jgi:hypothetical protein
MKDVIRYLAPVTVCTMLVLPRLAAAQTAPAISSAISTPDKVETRIGPLDFKDGMPSKDTIAKIYDNLDFTHAFEAFVNTLQGVSIRALHKAFLSIGVKDNEVLVFSELMDSKSLFLTANADTVYYMGMLNLTKGPMVLEVPPKALGAIDDYWFRWSSTSGCPGLIVARAGNTSSCRPATMVRCRMDSISPAPGPASSYGSLARFWRTTIRSPWPNRSESSPRSIHTRPAASAPPSPSS